MVDCGDVLGFILCLPVTLILNVLTLSVTFILSPILVPIFFIKRELLDAFGTNQTEKWLIWYTFAFTVTFCSGLFAFIALLVAIALFILLHLLVVILALLLSPILVPFTLRDKNILRIFITDFTKTSFICYTFSITIYCTYILYVPIFLVLCFILGPFIFPIILPSDFNFDNPSNDQAKEKLGFLYYSFIVSYYGLWPFWYTNLVKYCPEECKKSCSRFFVAPFFGLFLLIGWPFLLLFDCYLPGLYKTTSEIFWTLGTNIAHEIVIFLLVGIFCFIFVPIKIFKGNEFFSDWNYPKLWINTVSLYYIVLFIPFLPLVIINFCLYEESETEPLCNCFYSYCRRESSSDEIFDTYGGSYQNNYHNNSYAVAQSADA